jgi:hypothetical protein
VKTLYIIILVLFFCLSGLSQIDTIPTQFFGVAENESYTYISTNTGLYILERNSNNVFGEFHNVQDSLGLLHIHSNYLISGQDQRLKILNIEEPTNPNLILDTLLNFPIHSFDDFNNYFITIFGENNYSGKFLLSDVIGDKFQVKVDSDSTNPPISGFFVSSDFHYPYVFIAFPHWPTSDTIRTYKYDNIENKFNRLPSDFICHTNYKGVGAYGDLLFTGEYWTDFWGGQHYNQEKYSIDTLTNMFTFINSWGQFGFGPRFVNSFAIVDGWWTYIRNHNLSGYTNYGLPSWNYDYFVTGGNIYAAGNSTLHYSSKVNADSIIFKLIDFNPTIVEELETELEYFNLHQNYPNPFNPNTRINYQIPEQSFVTLKIFDVLGKEIDTLVNEEKPAGKYKVEFDGNGLPSGVYFYQLQAGSFVETKKMILLR